MTDLMLKLAIGIATKLLTESFLAKLLVHTLRAWSNTSENDYDDKVVDAIAEALGVDSKALKDLSK